MSGRCLPLGASEQPLDRLASSGPSFFPRRGLLGVTVFPKLTQQDDWGDVGKLAADLEDLVRGYAGHGAVLILVVCDYPHEVWKPPMPLLFQRRFGNARRTIPGRRCKRLTAALGCADSPPRTRTLQAEELGIELSSVAIIDSQQNFHTPDRPMCLWQRLHNVCRPVALPARLNCERHLGGALVGDSPDGRGRQRARGVRGRPLGSADGHRAVDAGPGVL